MSRRESIHAASGANTRGGGEPDYPAMFEAMAEAIMRRVPAPVAATVDVGVRVPRVDFAKMCKDFTSLGEKQFKGTEPAEEVQRWMDSCVQSLGTWVLRMQ